MAAPAELNHPHEILATNPDFHEFIMDLIERMGVSREDIQILFSSVNKERNMREFAKCFVTRYADASYNYEVYELAGDACLNNAVIMYFLNQIIAAQEEYKKTHPDFVSSKNTIDYYNKLKAVYISSKEFNDIAMRLGFDEFLIVGDISGIRAKDQSFDPEKLLCDSFESFIGCFEVMVDRYLKHQFSHYYVSNFVNYIFSNRKIDYRPQSLYDSITLLKETNDNFRRNYNVEYLVESSAGKTYLVFRNGNSKRRITAVEEMTGPPNITKTPMSKAALNYIKEILRNPHARDERSPDFGFVFRESEIRVPPDADTFGITSLIQQNFNDE
jgi:dsRNA-specific ribonuclease